MMCRMTDGPQFPFQQQPPPQQQQPQQPQQSWNAEPDWDALADESESHARRRKLMLIGGGVLAVAAVGGIVATAVVSANKQPTPAPPAKSAAPVQSLPPESAFPSVAAPSPENPLDILSDPEKDSAPLSAKGLFPAKRLENGGRTYVRTNTDGRAGCSSAVGGGLSAALANSGCRQVYRATYTRAGTAVTIGVAVFGSKAQADNAKNASGYILPLSGGGIGDFCHAVVCQMSSNSVGRYAYFTIAGPTDNTSVTKADTGAFQAGPDVSAVTFQLLVQRGREEANALLVASPAS